jgi:uncharacterized protein (DUF983 family)
VYEKFYDLVGEDEIDKALDYQEELWNGCFGLDSRCPHCGKGLLKSDVKGYHSVCLWCDENFYSVEEV